MVRIAYVLLGLLVFGLSACSTLRKLSRVETREIASVRSAIVVSPLRQKLIEFTQFAPACPEEIRSLLGQLADARVNVPPCPEGLQTNYEAVISVLKIEERSLIEQILNGQCRSFGKEGYDDTLDSLLNNFEVSRPLATAAISRKDTRILSGADEATALLAKVKANLEELRAVHHPLEQWIRRYGEFVIPEEELEFFERLIVTQNCKMTDQEIENSYRTMRAMEELMHTEREAEPQRALIERFLLGIHKVIDSKIREYFF